MTKLSYITLLLIFLFPVTSHSYSNEIYLSFQNAYNGKEFSKIVDLYKKNEEILSDSVSALNHYKIKVYLASALCETDDVMRSRKVYLHLFDNYKKGLGEQQQKLLTQLKTDCKSLENPNISSILELFSAVATADLTSSVSRTSGKVTDYSLYGAAAKTYISKESINSESETISNIEYPLFDVNESEKAESYFKNTFDNENVIYANSKYFFASSFYDIDQNRLSTLLHELDEFYEFMLASYELDPLPNLITVTIAEDRSRMSDLAKQLYGIDQQSYTMGLSMLASNSMLCMIPKDPFIYRGTLRHEIVHLLLNYNHPYLPPWLSEAIPTLYEATDRSQEKGIPNWRSEVIRNIKPNYEYVVHFEEETFNFPDFLLAGDDEFNGISEKSDEIEINHVKQSVNYAMARYYALFLQDFEDDNMLQEVFEEAIKPIPLLNESEIGYKQQVANYIQSNSKIGWDQFSRWLDNAIPGYTIGIDSRVQEVLKAEGFYDGEIDGQFGPNSKKALRKYQEAKNLSTTGVIDTQSLVHMGILNPSVEN